MQKTFCDLCGTEIANQTQGGVALVFKGCNTYEECDNMLDVCISCYGKLMAKKNSDTVNNIKKLLNN